MADRPLSIDIRHPLLLKANDLVLLTPARSGEIVRDVPGFGLFYRDTCYLAAYALRLNKTEPLLLMSSGSISHGFAIKYDHQSSPSLRGGWNPGARIRCLMEHRLVTVAAASLVIAMVAVFGLASGAIMRSFAMRRVRGPPASRCCWPRPARSISMINETGTQCRLRFQSGTGGLGEIKALKK